MPTYTQDFAKNVKLLLESEFWGLYNMVCDGGASRFEVAQELLTLLNLQKEISIKKVSSEFFKKEYFTKRPTSECLLNRRLNLRGLNIMRDWKISLREYLNDYYQEYL